jgi:hypothetical protein
MTVTLTELTLDREPDSSRTARGARGCSTSGNIIFQTLNGAAWSRDLFLDGLGYSVG